MKLESLWKKTLLASSLSLLLAGCGPAASEPRASEFAQSSQLQQQEETEEPAIAAVCPAEPELLDEACFHAENGPFQAVAAASLGNPSIPNVNKPHTAYNITLPADPLYSYAGSVSFRPAETSEYAFFLSRKRAFKIYDGDVLVSRECAAFIDETSCGSLQRMVMADLEAGKVYRLEFKAVLEQNATFTLVVEEAHHGHAEPLP